MRVTLAMAVAQIRAYVREPLALGWTVFFPVLLLLILGTVDTRLPDPPHPVTAGVGPEQVFLLMGIIGMNIASVGLFGLGLVLVQLRAIGFFRRLAMSPQPPWRFVAAQVLATATIVFATTAVLLTTGGLAFGIPPPARLALWSAFLVLGTGVFLAIGFSLAATVREPRTAQMLGNVVFLGFVLLGGVWYPVHVLPGPLRWISGMLPLPHLLQALRDTAIHGREPAALGEAAAVLSVWCLAASWLAVRRFRWRDAR